MIAVAVAVIIGVVAVTCGIVADSNHPDSLVFLGVMVRTTAAQIFLAGAICTWALFAALWLLSAGIHRSRERGIELRALRAAAAGIDPDDPNAADPENSQYLHNLHDLHDLHRHADPGFTSDWDRPDWPQQADPADPADPRLDQGRAGPALGPSAASGTEIEAGPGSDAAHRYGYGYGYGYGNGYEQPETTHDWPGNEGWDRRPDSSWGWDWDGDRTRDGRPDSNPDWHRNQLSQPDPNPDRPETQHGQPDPNPDPYDNRYRQPDPNSDSHRNWHGQPGTNPDRYDNRYSQPDPNSDSHKNRHGQPLDPSSDSRTNRHGQAGTDSGPRWNRHRQPPEPSPDSRTNRHGQADPKPDSRRNRHGQAGTSPDWREDESWDWDGHPETIQGSRAHQSAHVDGPWPGHGTESWENADWPSRATSVTQTPSPDACAPSSPSYLAIPIKPEPDVPGSPNTAPGTDFASYAFPAFDSYRSAAFAISPVSDQATSDSNPPTSARPESDHPASDSSGPAQPSSISGPGPGPGGSDSRPVQPGGGSIRFGSGAAGTGFSDGTSPAAGLDGVDPRRARKPVSE